MLTPAGLPEPDAVLTGHFDRSHEKRYAHIPFDMPAGVRQVHLRYSYSDRIPSDPQIAGGNTLDIGLFDEAGIAPGSPGFRGWSGSEKLAFTIDERWATPPYRAGPIGAGRWHIQLGPYKVGPAGCDWRVEIWFDPGLPPERRELARGPASPARLPAPAEPGWLRGDLHCHTVYSDGDSWPAEVVETAIEVGLEFLGVTDHNNVAHHAEYAAANRGRLILLPGVEVTTYGGHWNAWGTDRWFEFREPTAGAVEAAMEEAASDGAVVSVCHPKPFGPPWEYAEARGYHAIEVWNGAWERLNADALRFWEEHLRRGERVVAVGGSDTHRLRTAEPDPRHAQMLGRPTTWVRVEDARDEAGVLSALRAGRVFVSASAAGPQLYLDAQDEDCHVRAVGAQGALLAIATEGAIVDAAPIERDDWKRAAKLPPSARYVRAHIADRTGAILALTNPVWLESS